MGEINRKKSVEGRLRFSLGSMVQFPQPTIALAGIRPDNASSGIPANGVELNQVANCAKPTAQPGWRSFEPDFRLIRFRLVIPLAAIKVRNHAGLPQTSYIVVCLMKASIESPHHAMVLVNALPFV